MTLIATWWTIVVGGLYVRHFPGGPLPDSATLSITFASVVMMWLILLHRNPASGASRLVASVFTITVLIRMAIGVSRHEGAPDGTEIVLTLVMIAVIWWIALMGETRRAAPLGRPMLWIGGTVLGGLTLGEILILSPAVPLYPDGLRHFSVLAIIGFGFLRSALDMDSVVPAGTRR